MTEPRTFTRDPERPEWPVPMADPRVLSDADLADYIAVSSPGFDGLSASAREAIVRLLRRPVNGESTPQETKP